MTAYIWQSANLTEAVKDLNPTFHSDFTQTSTKIITDTRKIEQGDIFLAIQGDNFDGHDYVQTAKDKGAVLAIVSRAVESDLPQLVVTDTKLALGKLGAYRRDQHPNLKVVAITGSSGKTTAKEMLGSILNRIAPTLITRGNLNNDLGVPMMLLELTDDHRYAVMELGANHVGEIAYTTQLVKPDVACVLNIGTAHLGEFGGRDNIAKTKSEIYQGLSDTGTAIVPFGDDYFDTLLNNAQQFTQNILTFGERDVSLADAGVDMQQAKEIGLTDEDTVLLMGDVFADDVEVGNTSTFSLNFNFEIDEIESQNVSLNFAGEHNISNALAAAACAQALGLSIDDIAKGLDAAKPAKGRLNFIEFGKHTLIDDTYNANPSAVVAATQVLVSQGAPTMLVLGDIGELGDAAQEEHRKLGETIAASGVTALYTVGELTPVTVAQAQASGMQAQAYPDKATLLAAIKDKLASSDDAWHILFKGSRYMMMEQVMDALIRQPS